MGSDQSTDNQRGKQYVKKDIERNEQSLESKPSKQAALEREDARRFRKVERTEGNKLIKRDFPLFASSLEISEGSTGLAVYFKSLWEISKILLALGIFTLPYLISAAQIDRLTNNRTVIAIDENDGSPIASKKCEWPSSTVGWALYTSLGAYCDDTTEAELSNNCGFSNDTLTCRFHQAEEFLDNPENDPCSCNTELTQGDGQVSRLAYAMVFVSQFVLLFATYLFQLTFSRASIRWDLRKATAADYTLQVEGLKGADRDDDVKEGEYSGETARARLDVAEYFAPYGDVANVARPLTHGKREKLDKELRQLDRAKHELAVPGYGMAEKGIVRFIYRMFFLDAASEESVDKKIKDKQEQLDEEEENAEVKPLSRAFVTFDAAKTKERVMRDFDRVSKIPPIFRKQQHEQLRVIDAPEPTDVYWKNFDESKRKRARFQLLVTMPLTLLILAISIGAQIAVAIVNDNSRKDGLNNEVQNERDNESTQGLSLQALPVLGGIIAGVANIGGRIVIRKFVNWEQHPTYTDAEKTLMFRLSLFMVLNAVVPAIPASPGFELYAMYVRGGFAEQAIYTQLIAGFVPDIAQLFDPLRFVFRGILPNAVRTQRKMNELFEPEDFSLSTEYVSLLRSLGMAIVFTPLNPISAWIGLLGVGSTNLVDRYIAFTRVKTPRSLGADISRTVVEMVAIMCFLQAIFVPFVYFWDVGDAFPYVMTSSAILLVGMILPVRLEDDDLDDLPGWLRTPMRYFFPKTNFTDKSTGRAYRKTYSQLIREADDVYAEGQDEEKLIYEEHHFHEIAPNVSKMHYKDVYAPLPPTHTTKEHRDQFIKYYRLFEEPVRPPGLNKQRRRQSWKSWLRGKQNQ